MSLRSHHRFVIAVVATAGCGGIVAAPAEDRAALVGASCAASTVVLTNGQPAPFAVATDGVRAYWVDVSDGAIRAVPRLGGPVVDLVTAQALPESIAVDATSVYWGNVGHATSDGSIASVSKLGGAVRTIASGQPFPQQVAVEGADVYWSVIGGVRTAPKCGGPARTVVASETIPTFAVDAGWLYSAAADGDTLLLRTPRHGGAATALAGPLRVAFLAADGGNVYFRGGADIETISRVPIRGGAVATVGAAPGGGSFTTFIAVDERAVYFLSEDAVWRLAKSGGAAEAIAVHQPMPQGIAVDAGDVYWSTAPDPFGGSIRRVPKRCRAQ